MLETIGKDMTTLKDTRKQPEIIAITSGKGGVGKSSLSINTALVFRQMRKRVLLIDADIHLGNVDLLLGMRTVNTLEDLLKDGMDIRDIIVEGPGQLDVLPASSASMKMLEMEDILLKKLAAAFRKIESNYDYVIVDTGAGVAQTVLSFLLGADKIVLVITSDPASIADAYAVIKIVKTMDAEIPVLVVPNQVNAHEEGEVLYKKLNLMVRKFLKCEIEYAGSVLKDELIAKSVKIQKPFVLHNPNSAAANTMRLFTRQLLQLTPKTSRDKRNVFDRFIVNKKRNFEWD